MEHLPGALPPAERERQAGECLDWYRRQSRHEREMGRYPGQMTEGYDRARSSWWAIHPDRDPFRFLSPESEKR